ncbi:hypothetical protein [Brevundimonas sp.]|jgi:hypothetical protein|uniref:hypothetical protein n=1 Tax=Brevundimonas sp. TaxID=1871086 RepID=UPI003784EEC2
MNDKLISETEAKLMTHEEVCAQRYAAIKQSFEAGDKRMTKIEYLLYAVIAAVLFGPGVAAEFVRNIIGV